MGFTIRAAQITDLDLIAAVHVSAFPGFFLTNMGKRFLKQYYRCYLETKEMLLVAVDSDSEMAGFVAGMQDNARFYKHMKKHGYRFLLPVVFALLDFKLLMTCTNRIFTIFRSNRVNEGVLVPDGYHELTSIAVSPMVRQSGVGKLLMNAYLDAVKSIDGITGVFLTTDSDNNANVHGFYKSVGFRKASEFTQGDKRRMTAYSLMLDD